MVSRILMLSLFLFACAEQTSSVQASPRQRFLEAWRENSACEERCRSSRDAKWSECNKQYTGIDDAEFARCESEVDARQDRCLDRCTQDFNDVKQELAEERGEPGDAEQPSPVHARRHDGLGNSDDSGRRASGGFKCMAGPNSGQSGPIPVQFASDIPSMGWTDYYPGMGWIIKLRSDFQRLSPALQRFVLAHECGHANSGDRGPGREVSASQWAAANLGSLMSHEDWEEVHQMLVQRYPVAGNGYPDGESHWQALAPYIAE